MWVNIYGADYYLDEVAFAERMAQPPPPYRIDEIVAIQHRLKESNERLRDQMSSPRDPLVVLREYLESLKTT